MYSLYLLLNKFEDAVSSRSLGKVPGLKFIYRFIIKKIGPRIVLIEIQNNKFYLNINDIGIARNLIQGNYEKYETEIFKRFIKSNTILIDIGANIGYYTIMASNLVKNGQIYSFEPELNNYNLLIKNVRVNDIQNVIPIQKAVSNKESKIKIFTDSRNLGNHSLAESNVPDKLGFLKVETITLDSLSDDLDNDAHIFIKMDTQGAEGLVIDGAKKLLRKNNITILMEFWPKGLENMGSNPLELLNNLEMMGFKVEVIDDVSESLKCLNFNEILDMCKTSKDKDQVNLLLQK